MSLEGKNFKLNDGKLIPAVGYGTGTKWFKLGRNEVDKNLVSVLETAIDVGITHIDGAEVYNTALEIGEALANSKKRSDIFLTDKYFAGDGTYQHRSEFPDPYQSLQNSLKRFGTDYVDLYLIHSPYIKKETHGFTLEEAWGFLEKAVEDGLAKSIGVSNFEVADLEKILKVAKIKPAANQIEYNAFLQNQTPGIVAFSQSHNILVEAYSSLGPIFKGDGSSKLEAYLNELTSKYQGKDAGQILLRWVLQNGVLPVTTSANRSRIEGLLAVLDFEITAEEVSEITKLGKEHGTFRQYWKNEFSKYD